MVKIKISYVDQQDKEKVIQVLSRLKIIEIGKEQVKKNHKNVYTYVSN